MLKNVRVLPEYQKLMRNLNTKHCTKTICFVIDWSTELDSIADLKTVSTFRGAIENFVSEQLMIWTALNTSAKWLETERAEREDILRGWRLQSCVHLAKTIF